MHRLAIDLGTSNTVAVLRGDDGQVRPVLFDGREQLSSAVHAGAGGVLVAGLDAERLARADPAAFEPNPKRRIDDGTVLLGPHAVAVTDALATVLAAVAARVPRTPPTGAAVPSAVAAVPPESAAMPVAGSVTPSAGAAVPAAGVVVPVAGSVTPSADAGAAGQGSVVLTVPAGWGAPRREVLACAASRAGLGAVEFVSEPVAAAAYFTATRPRELPPGAALLVVDLGAGTADLAVVRDGQVIAQGGLDVGGLDVDAALVGVLGDVVSATEPDVWQRLSAPVTAADRRDRLLLWQEVRAAKESLSRLSVAPVHVPGCRSDPHLTREELEAAAAPLLAPIADLAATLTAAALTDRRPDSLADRLADVRSDPLADSLADRLADVRSDPLADSLADRLADVRSDPLADSPGDRLTDRRLAHRPGPLGDSAGDRVGDRRPGRSAAPPVADPALPAAPAGELAAVFLVGGGSRLPLLARLLHARLGVAPTTVERPETVVAEGALHAMAATAPDVKPAAGPAPAPAAPVAPPRTPLRRRWRSPATVLLVLLCFALPFATVSCGLPDGYGRAQPGGTSEYTGFDLASGGAPAVRKDQLRPPDQWRPDRLAPQPAYVAALLLLAAALAATALGRDRRRRAVTAALAALAVLVLAAGQALVTDRLAAAVLEQSRMPEGRTADDMVGTGPGFWLAVILLTLLTTANLAASHTANPAGRRQAPVRGRRTGG
ncbi:rod shape-determining protein [Dactylosporangium sp. NPDC049525]|uniref:rod shape-determining protein n=1 Tax=Dactylosporangium sp. NPDC049525 TaxID=3154730 RepID=UPI00341D3A4C